MSYSQFGEDILIRDLFKRIGTENKWCVEIGAHDGEYFSNTLMFREYGWHAVLAEKEEGLFVKMKHRYGGNPKVICCCEEVTYVDEFLSYVGREVPRRMDFMSIDIDGDDYWLWHDMDIYRPRVLCIEFNPYVTHPTHDPDNPQPRGSNFPYQTAKKPLLDLAERKGYRLEADTFCNLIFVDKEIDDPSSL